MRKRSRKTVAVAIQAAINYLDLIKYVSSFDSPDDEERDPTIVKLDLLVQSAARDFGLDPEITDLILRKRAELRAELTEKSSDVPRMLNTDLGLRVTAVEVRNVIMQLTLLREDLQRSAQSDGD